MELVPQTSSLNLPPTAKQCRRIALFCRALGIREPLEEQVVNRHEARNLIYDLLWQLKRKEVKHVPHFLLPGRSRARALLRPKLGTTWWPGQQQRRRPGRRSPLLR